MHPNPTPQDLLENAAILFAAARSAYMNAEDPQLEEYAILYAHLQPARRKLAQRAVVFSSDQNDRNTH